MNAQQLASRTSALAALVLASGCSTTVSVENLSPDLAPTSKVDGIPFRAKERYRVRLYKLEGGKYQEVEVKETFATLANQDQLYVLKMKGSPLSDGTVKVKINSDSTLSFVGVESTSRGQDVLTELSKGAKSIAATEAARDEARTTADKTAETDVVATEDSRIAALDAQRDALLAQLELEALAVGASSLDRAKAEQKLIRARVFANQKARRAELPLPYPDAGT
jgi:hypothetical protein